MSDPAGDVAASDERDSRAEEDFALLSAARRRSLAAIVLGNITWAATLLLVFLVAVRILLVSRLDVSTATALAGASSTVTIATVVLVSAIPVVLSTASVAVLFLFLNLDRAARDRWIALALVSQFLLVTVAVQVAPPVGIFFCCFAMVGTVAGNVVLTRRENRPPVGDAANPLLAEFAEIDAERDRLRTDLAAAESALDLAWREQSELEDTDPGDRDPAELDRARSRYDAALRTHTVLTEQRAALRGRMAAAVARSEQWVSLVRQRTPEWDAEDSRHARSEWFWAWAFAATLALIPATSLFTSQPWVPAERMEIQGGPPIVGYVLKDSDFFTILREDNRQVSIVRKERITTRTVCRPQRSQAAASRWFRRILVRNPGAGYEAC